MVTRLYDVRTVGAFYIEIGQASFIVVLGIIMLRIFAILVKLLYTAHRAPSITD